jgi:MoxR-like ATPase
MYNDYDMVGTPTGASGDGEGADDIVIHTDMGRRMVATDLSKDDLDRLTRDLRDVDISVVGWYVKLTATDETPIGKGGTGGGTDGEQGEQGEADGTGEGEAGEGEGEQCPGGEHGEDCPEHGEGCPGDDEEEEADGDADGDQEEKGKEEEMQKEFESPDMGDQEAAEQEALSDDRLLQEIWDRFRPLIAGRDDIHANSMADYVHKVASRHSGGSGTGTLIKVGKGKIHKVDGSTHELFEKVLAAVARKVHVYLPGPPGTGKSHMVEQIAEALQLAFGVTSFSSHSGESKLLGFRNAHGEYISTVFRERYEFGGVMLLDELDNSNPNIVAVTNGGLANGQMEFPDGVVKCHPDFVAIATANTLGTGPTAEFAGRMRLDPATLNRFVKIQIHTDEVLEDRIVNGMIGDVKGQQWLKKIRHVRRACDELRIKHFVTMRDSINGAKLIATGAGAFTQLEALEYTCLGSLSADQVDKIKTWKG